LAFVSSNSENISCVTFQKHKNSRKQGTGTMASFFDNFTVGESPYGVNFILKRGNQAPRFRDYIKGEEVE
jgi:hypothetical protein